MNGRSEKTSQSKGRWAAIVTALCATGIAVASLIPMTLQDFMAPGTQVGEILPGRIIPSNNCTYCHADYNPADAPYDTWYGSLMGQAGRDPLFYAQMATANQDVANVGYYCLRCHVPMSIVTGHAYQPDGSTLDATDNDGVSCHLCHTMVDPIFKPGVSPPQDENILNVMSEVPSFYGNAMFVLDPNGTRRGPYNDATSAGHASVASPFHRTGDFCGTCHDVGNLATTKQPDGTYRYNAIDAASPTFDPHQQFPLERTYTEWKLSAFANGGVDMGGRFGGTGPAVVSTCQDCHMPKTTGKGCFYGPDRTDLARHDFAGASAWVLEIIKLYYRDDPDVNTDLIEVGRLKAIDMVERAASLELTQDCGAVRTRVINETGHKLPTGHIEGRRVWVTVKFLDAGDNIVREYGHYDPVEAHLDEESTVVYEMHVGLSEFAANLTGYPAGETTHMALADTIEKDNRIPPRGFNNAAYEAGGAPTVGEVYADGQYWDDTLFWIPDRAVRADVTVYYATVTRHYIEALRNGNVTDHWGQTLYDLWNATNRGAPIAITSESLPLAPFARGDSNADGDVDLADYAHLAACMNYPGGAIAEGCACEDFDGDRDVDMVDFAGFQRAYNGG